jgi:hypothetical protein
MSSRTFYNGRSLAKTPQRCISVFLLGVCLSLASFSHAQLFRNGKLYDSKLYMVKTGPYIGLEQGKYLNFNFGVERQIQQIKLLKPQTHAVNAQFDYNFKQQVMGAQLGYWFKSGRLNLTYGARVSWRTDYEVHRFGFSPNVGYKLLQAHFQLGVHLMGKSDHFTNTNTFYASLRYVFINNRDLKRKK